MESPYVGLRSYETEDAPRFFGRSEETRELTSLLFASRLVIVYGSPGVGKSSLIRAGVLATLSPDAAQVLPVGRASHVSALSEAKESGCNPYTLSLLASWRSVTPQGRPATASITQFLDDMPSKRDRYDDELPLIAVIDQFEEVFRADPEWLHFRDEFLEQLAEAVEETDRLRLLLSMREDVVGEVLPHESQLSRNYRSRFQVRALLPEAALQAVTGPLRTTSRSFAEGVAETLIDRLQTVIITDAEGKQNLVKTLTVEPIKLQVVCSSLWDALPDEIEIITTEHLQDHGDVDATLTRFCAEAVVEISKQENVPELTVWEWLEWTFITELGTRGAAFEGIAGTAGMPHEVPMAFERHRILRSEKRAGSVWYELQHDGLIEPIKRGRRQASDRGETPSADTRPDTFLRMAETALADGMFWLAEQYAWSAVRASDNNPRTLARAEFLLAKLVFDQGRAQTGNRADELYEMAEKRYRHAAELFAAEQDLSTVGYVLGALGQLYTARGRFVDAVSVLQSALTRLRNDFDIRMSLAEALQGAGQTQAALGEYGGILTVAPETVAALVGRGTIDAEHGDPTSALADLDNAIRLQPELAGRPDVVSARERANARLERQA